MVMKRYNPVLTNALADSIVRLAAARVTTRRRQSVRLRRRMVLQVSRCFAEIARPFFERQHRAKHLASGTPEFGHKQYLPEHGGDEEGEL